MASPNTTVPLFLALLLCFLLHPYPSSASLFNWSTSVKSHNSPLAAIELPTHLSFNAVTSSDGSRCTHHLDAASPSDQNHHGDSIDGENEDDDAREESSAPAASTLKLHLKHRSSKEPGAPERTKKESLLNSTHRDLSRIHTLFGRIVEKKNRNTISRLRTTAGEAGHRSIASELAEKVAASAPPELAGRLMVTLESGVSLGSGEYFMDVFVGTPPRHFSLILDTGSDLNWIQCLPCHDCFDQHGPLYDPAASSTYHNVSCADTRCGLVSPPWPCRSGDQACPYFYWYGDRSNTTGDLALETFTVNLTATDGGGGAEFRRVDEVIFGCGHWNRGLFHGAAGLLGLGRGPLSFSSQLRALYGHTFSYCLVDRDSDLTVSSKLIFGEDRSLLSHPDLNYTSFVDTAGKEDSPADTFYYVQVREILVGGEVLPIPPETWKLSAEGTGGTIVDSGTTLSYFADPAYQVIKEAFVGQAKAKYPVVDFPILSPCYNVSGVEKVEMPGFAIRFADGAVWNFPVENYFIRLDPEEVVCLAILGTPRSSLSILGNYLQQNFHIMYDMNKSRLGFAPMKCAQV
ncbi:aspartyl protease family protein 2-like [Elaeis guineensis]|uniref:Aspartyl protease family protein 2-like n=1 Tax=Elaeis guineensis var. tenera TaxID=51953 RepID=A0A6I9Q896_ELAGV|nr:aspartyl protease family protein 2-like [Elaeis guineensis]